MKRRGRRLLITVVAFFIPDMLLAQGCAMCKATVESATDTQRLGAGLNNGILLLMAVPYVLLFLLFRKKLLGFLKEFSSAQG